jgi:O-antigen/teichoic acid export membrane protein
VIACLTVPAGVIHILLPSSYVDATRLLRYTAVSGAAVGWIDMVSTLHQARARFRPAIRILGVAAVCHPIVLIAAGRLGGIWAFAAALTSVSVIAAIALTFDARCLLALRVRLSTTLLCVCALGAAFVVRTSLPAWAALIVVIGAVGLRVLVTGLRGLEQPGGATEPGASSGL